MSVSRWVHGWPHGGFVSVKVRMCVCVFGESVLGVVSVSVCEGTIGLCGLCLCERVLQGSVRVGVRAL